MLSFCLIIIASFGLKMRSLTIVAPSNTMKDLNGTLRHFAEKHLSSMNFKISYGKNVDHQFLNMAGTAEDRISDLESALINPSIDGVMAVFGGYNTNELLPKISYHMFEQENKKTFFVGYSDITALLIAFSQRTNIDCYHGPGFASFADPNLFNYTKNAFLQAISRDSFSIADPGFYADDLWYMKDNFGPREIKNQISWTTYQSGTITAPILGGNLDTLCALAGTDFFPDFKNKILFVEDSIGDTGVFYRNMTQLEQVGVFDQIAGLIIGKFPSRSLLNDNERLFSLLRIVLKKKSIPVVCHVHCSHVDPMITVPLEQNCTIEARNEPFLILNAK